MKVMSYLDCGCAIVEDGSRTLCPSCASPPTKKTSMRTKEEHWMELKQVYDLLKEAGERVRRTRTNVPLDSYVHQRLKEAEYSIHQLRHDLDYCGMYLGQHGYGEDDKPAEQHPAGSALTDAQKIQKAIDLLQWMHNNCLAPDITAHDAVTTCSICRLIAELKAPNEKDQT